MQRIYFTALTPEGYIASEAHRQVIAELICPQCGKGRLHRHGTYGRGITGLLGQLLWLLVARFICCVCDHTVSYLPSFALSYRLVQAATFEAFLDGKIGRGDVQRWQSVLGDYRRRMTRFAEVVVRTVGCGFGRAPPPAPAEGGAVWSWLKGACGGMESATRLLVATFKITLFRRYQCHQPAEVS
jgi:transposase-like protein